ncbi:hypothetical protein SDC9_106416 [bioreactor metagenome]|uniref:Uncharacterized protein n=1 Tax=bioreactor metagenome TaxID=1076179 RepID=A0A645B293_9ZZZZ
MKSIADQLDHQPVIQQHGIRQRRLDNAIFHRSAVIGVIKMAYLRNACRHGRGQLAAGESAVAHRHYDPAPGQPPDDLSGSGQFRRDGHYSQRLPGGLPQQFHFRQVGQP